MGYIDFKKLKERVAITSILDHYGLLAGLKETPRGFQGTCPFCGSTAFKVNTEKNAWFCFGECKTKADATGGHNGGNIIDFVARKEGVAVMTAARHIAEWLPESPAAHAPVAKEPQPVPNKEPARPPETPAVAEAGQAATTPAPTPAPPQAQSIESTLPVVAPPEINLMGLSNKPLEFALKTFDVENPAPTQLGISRETLRAFGVSYFTGKGIMHNKVVIPFDDAQGRLIAYAGYSPADGSITYPKSFDQRLELFNFPRAENMGVVMDALVIVTDLLNVLRLYELGLYRVVALTTEKLYPPQMALLERLVGDGGLVEFVPWTPEYRDNLRLLSEHFHVRLHRYYEGSEDEFLAQVVCTVRC